MRRRLATDVQVELFEEDGVTFGGGGLGPPEERLGIYDRRAVRVRAQHHRPARVVGAEGAHRGGDDLGVVVRADDHNDGHTAVRVAPPGPTPYAASRGGH